MNRFKLVCLLIILSIVAILLGQNREPLSLKLFCPDVTSQSCLYRTPALPLAAWIGLFAIAGIISSLLWQFLNQLARPAKRYSDPPRQNRARSQPKVDYTRPETVASSTPTSDWEEPKGEDWESDRVSQVKKDPLDTDRTVYRVQDKTRDVSSTDSTYSYKFREAKPKKSDRENVAPKTKTDEVYDVNYRTVSPPSTKNPDPIDDDEEWI